MRNSNDQPTINDPEIVIGGTVWIEDVDEGYRRGTITDIKNTLVKVDFLDWIQQYRVSDIRVDVIEEFAWFGPVLCSYSPGVRIEDFGQAA